MNSRSSTRRTGRRRGRLLLTIAVLAVLAVAADGSAGGELRALGDPYAAGPLIPIRRCRSAVSGRATTTRTLAAPSIGLTLRDASCSGAKTVDMTDPQSVDRRRAEPAAVQLADASTTVVSVTIGGNDIGFSEVAQSCITVNPFRLPAGQIRPR